MNSVRQLKLANTRRKKCAFEQIRMEFIEMTREKDQNSIPNRN